MEVYFDKSSEVLIVGLTVYATLALPSSYSERIADFHISHSYVLGFALGPLLWAPLSELYGRRIIFITTYGPFVVFQIGCALATNIETLIICRWFAGFFGSSPITNAGAIIADSFPASTRALALSMYVPFPLSSRALLTRADHPGPRSRPTAMRSHPSLDRFLARSAVDSSERACHGGGCFG